VLQSYLPVLVFAGLGILVGGAFALLNSITGPRRPNPIKGQPYECGLPSHITRTFRFGVSFYMIAMLFILFDILVFVVLLLVALVFVWRRGALDWK
jgi:NADH-quinone oxidoreductase subunit A